MKTGNKTWKLLAPIVVLVCICLAITTALAFANLATRPVIDAANQAKADAAMQVVLPGGSGFEAIEGVAFDEAVLEAQKAGNGAGYAFRVASKGYGGAMTVMVGLDAGGTVTGTQVITSDETPSVGGILTKDGSDFQRSLVGATAVEAVDAQAGATITSNGLKRAVQAALDAYTVANGGTVTAEAAPAPESLTEAVLEGYYPGAAFTDVPGGKVSDAGTVVYAKAQGMGEIRVAVCFDPDGNILGIAVDVPDETPGYGAQCGEPAFTDLFAGVRSGGEVDTIAGVTITSDAVKGAVDDAIKHLETVKGAA